MAKKRKPKGYWKVKEHCLEEARKYTSKYEFSQKNSRAYKYACKNGWIDEVEWTNGKLKWTYDVCYKEAMLYEYQWQFRHNSPVAYCIARRKKWIKDYYWLKKANGTDKPIDIYAYEDRENNVVYVGLSTNVNERHYRHKNGILQEDGSRKYDAVGEYFNSIGKEIPKPIVKMSELETGEDGQYYEDWYRNAYENAGWTVLNKAKTGIGSSSIGGSRKIWTEDAIRKEAKKYSSSAEFGYKNGSAYRAASKMGILRELFQNMRKPKGWWKDIEHHKEEIAAHNCTTKFEYEKVNESAYSAACKYKLIDMLFAA